MRCRSRPLLWRCCGGSRRWGDQGIVFPGMRAGQPLSDVSLTAVLRRSGRGALMAHGFRASFKTWTSDETIHARELIEASLPHAVGDRAE
jgi:hypothetical protein